MPGNEIRFQQVMSQGHSAAWEQLWDRAASFYRMALEEFPDHPQALISLGLALYETMDYKASLDCYQKAAVVSPDDPIPLEKIGELNERLNNLDLATEYYLKAADLYARRQDMNKAIENWARITRLNPEHLLAHSRLAVVFERIGRTAQAVTEYLAVASLMQQAGETNKAVQAINRGLQLAPGNAEAMQALSLLRAGQPLPKPTRARGGTGRLILPKTPSGGDAKEGQPEALEPIAEARKKALATLAGLVFEGGDEEPRDGQASRRGLQAIMQGAVSHLGTKTVDQHKIMLHLSQAIDLQSQEKDGQAVEELEHAVEAGLDHPAASFDLGMLMAVCGRLESAIRYLQRAVKHTDYMLGARLLLGQIMKKMGRTREAAVEYLEALKVADALVAPPEQAEELAQLYEPVIETLSKQPDDVQERLCANITDLLLRPDWREHLSLSRQQIPSREGVGPLLPLAEMLVESHGSQVVDSIARIHELAHAGFQRAAMEEAYFALQHAPTYLPLHMYIGELLLKQDRVQGAIEKFRVVAHSYSIRGEAGRSISMYRRILDLAPMDMNLRNQLIDQLIALGQVSDAINEHLNLADVYYNQADLVNARKTYAQALQLAQQTNADRLWKVKTLHRMADIDLQSLDWRQALRDFEQIRNLEPDDEKARTSLIDLNFRLGQSTQALAELDNYVAFLWKNGQKQPAVVFLEKMIVEYPKQPSIRRRLAEMYRQAGRGREAILQLDTAADMLVEAGDRAGAIEALMALIALNPPNVAEYQRVLAKLREK
jgi:tetratricopeptide (TPR) repeat protein